MSSKVSIPCYAVNDLNWENRPGKSAWADTRV